MALYKAGGGGTTQVPKVARGPRHIFLGWTALVFAAAGGYFYVKSANTEKKRRYLLEQSGLKSSK
jgi:hypothetical protein